MENRNDSLGMDIESSDAVMEPFHDLSTPKKVSLYCLELQGLRVKNEALSNKVTTLKDEALRSEKTVLDERRKRVGERQSYLQDIDSVNQELSRIRELYWVEKSKNTLLSNELDAERAKNAGSMQHVQEISAANDRVSTRWLSEHSDNEAVIQSLTSIVHDLRAQLSDTEQLLADSETTIGKLEKEYGESLRNLEDENARMLVEKQHAASKIADLSKENSQLKSQMSHFTSNPTEQFKLTLDLFNAYVAGEEKVHSLEEREKAVSAKQRENEEIMRRLLNELAECKTVAEEYRSALELGQLPATGSRQSTEPTASNEQELQLEFYRKNWTNEQRALIEQLSQQPGLFQQFMSVADKDAVLYAFVREHGAAEHLQESAKLKEEHSIKTSQVELQKTEIERITAVLDSQKRESLEETQKMQQQIDQVKASAANFDHLKAELERSIAEKSLDNDRIKSDLLQARADLERLKAQYSDLSRSCEEAATRESALTEKLVGLEHEKDRGDIEKQELLSRVEDLQTALKSAHPEGVLSVYLEKLNELRRGWETADAWSSLTSKLKDAEQQIRTLESELSKSTSSLAGLNDENQSLSRALDELRNYLSTEQQSHHATSESLSTIRAELAAATSQLIAKEAKTTEITELMRKREHENQLFTTNLTEQIKLITENEKNSNAWKAEYFASVGSHSGDTASLELMAIKRLRAENDLVRRQVELSKKEAELLISMSTWKDKMLTELITQTKSGVVEDADSVLLAKRYDECKNHLRIVLQSSEMLRAELLDLRAERESLKTQLAERDVKHSEAQAKIASLERQLTELQNKLTEMNSLLEESNRRFDTDIQRQEIERLRKQLAEADQKSKSEKEKMKNFYVKQFTDMKKKAQDDMREKDEEIARVRTELEGRLQASEVALGTEKERTAAAVEERDAKTAELASVKRKFEMSVTGRASLVEQHKLETDELRARIAQLEATVQHLSNEIRTLRSAQPSAAPTPIRVQQPSRGISENSAEPSSNAAPAVRQVRSTARIPPQAQPVMSTARIEPQLRSPAAPAIAPSTSRDSPASSGYSLQMSPPASKLPGSGPQSPMPSTSSDMLSSKRQREADGEQPTRPKRVKDAVESSGVSSSTVRRKGQPTVRVKSATPSAVEQQESSDASNSAATGDVGTSEIAFVPVGGMELEAGSAVGSEAGASVFQAEYQGAGEVESAQGSGENVLEENAQDQEPMQQDQPEVSSDENEAVDVVPEARSTLTDAQEEPGPSGYEHQGQSVIRSTSAPVAGTSTPRLARLPSLPSPLATPFSMPHLPNVAPPRTPGIIDPSDDGGFGVVPSTPKITPRHSEEDLNALPEVPSFSFANLAEFAEDTTASQVPPTPRHDNQFFGQRTDPASEDSGDSSSFSAPNESVVDSFAYAVNSAPVSQPSESLMEEEQPVSQAPSQEVRQLRNRPIMRGNPTATQSVRQRSPIVASESAASSSRETTGTTPALGPTPGLFPVRGRGAGNQARGRGKKRPALQ